MSENAATGQPAVPVAHSDQLQRFLFEGFAVRGHLVHLDAAWRALIEHHDYPHIVRDTLGEATAAAVLMVATLKFEGVLTLQLQGPGPLHLLVAHCTDRHAVRGVARWRTAPEGPELARLTGGGQLTVTVDKTDQSARYQGVVPLTGARIADCLEDYFRRSEQLPTRLWLAATPERVAGLLLQRLPHGARASAEADTRLTEDLDEHWNRVLHLAGTLTAPELLDLPSATLLRRIFHEEDLRLFEPAPVYFQCTCSRARVERILRALGAREAQEVLAERGAVEVRCEFCNRNYRFDAVDVAALFASEAPAPHPPGRH